METGNLLRHQIINNLLEQPTENVADDAVQLWHQMASKIIPLVGEVGFSSLYGRSLFLMHSRLPWLPADALTTQNADRFTPLKISFEGQTPVQAGAANSLLLITFSDILASLIGEHLTTSILRSAWVNEKDAKELKNE